MNWIMEIGISDKVLDLVAVCVMLVAFSWWIWERWQPYVEQGQEPLNNRTRRQVKKFYAKKKNRNKGMVLDEDAGKVVVDFSPKDYGMYVRKRK